MNKLFTWHPAIYWLQVALFGLLTVYSASTGVPLWWLIAVATLLLASVAVARTRAQRAQASSEQQQGLPLDEDAD